MWRLLRRVLFLLDPEEAHALARWTMWLVHRFLPLPGSLEANPIGLAAGFDKNAELIRYLPRFGFGSVEIGTVTPRPQGGNPRPRLFRDPAQKALFNRMGFNNLGAGILSERVRQAKPQLPPGFRVGVNLGKNKDTPDAEAARDYAAAARPFLDTADYFVINVSSPNTPGLRALQAPESLTRIVEEVRGVLAEGPRTTPLWVKLAPEIGGAELQEILTTLEKVGVSGVILTNTRAGDYIYRGKALTGGWSGQILTRTALERLKEARNMTRLPILSVGGIMNAQDALERLQAGAVGVQLYTGWIYGGPLLPFRILRALKKG